MVKKKVSRLQNLEPSELAEQLTFPIVRAMYPKLMASSLISVDPLWHYFFCQDCLNTWRGAATMIPQYDYLPTVKCESCKSKKVKEYENEEERDTTHYQATLDKSLEENHD